jgi:hypothetical protein
MDVISEVGEEVEMRQIQGILATMLSYKWDQIRMCLDK